MTSLLRIGLALAWTALLAVPTLPVLVLLLPSRRARMIVSAWYGRGLSWGALRLLGVTATLEGAEHLAAARPAVCVANHSSNLDPFLAMDHNPIGYVGVAKREIVSIPVFGLMYVLSGHVRIDRGDSKGAVASLAETAALVRRHGLGFYLWPEGTMPRDGQLLPFKKGFVHLAIATGLPVIPIVVYGAADRWPPRTLTLRPGRVHVRVLPPVSTEGWTAERAQEHADAVRELYVRALAEPRPC